MRRRIIIVILTLCCMGKAMAQMPTYEEIHSEAMQSYREAQWCQAKYLMLWAALSPECTTEMWEEMMPMIQKAESAMKEEQEAEGEDTLRNHSTEMVPSFQGGDAELCHFIMEHLHLTKPAYQYFNQMVFVRLTIERDGRISHASISPNRGYTPEDDEACLKMVGEMPYWRPGAKDCIPVRCDCILPIKLNLERYQEILDHIE